MLLNKKNYLAIFLITIALIALAACGNGASENDKNNSNNETETEATQDDVEQVLNLSTTADITSLDIHHAADGPSFDALYQISAGLIGYDKDEIGRASCRERVEIWEGEGL